jgi:hypothetical protein
MKIYENRAEAYVAMKQMNNEIDEIMERFDAYVKVDGPNGSYSYLCQYLDNEGVVQLLFF